MPVRVTIRATDPVTHAGLASALRVHPRIEPLTEDARQHADLTVVATHRFDADDDSLLRRAASALAAPTVLIVGEMTEADVVAAMECRVVAVLGRSTVTGDRLGNAVTAAATADIAVGADLLAALMRQVREIRQDGDAPRRALSPRETDVLRLVAEGADTLEIAQRLSYSERTVKNILYGLTSRLHLRNRPHAVAFAIRAGII